MKKRTFLLGVAVAVSIAACSRDITAPRPGDALFSAPRALKDILYELNDDAPLTARKAVEEILNRHGISNRRQLVNGRVAHAHIARANGRSEQQIVADLIATGGVEFAEVDELLEPAVLPFSFTLLPANDPMLPLQWHHNVINSAGAWDHSTGAASIKVAICDTGVDRLHPDLFDNVPDAGWSIVDNAAGGGPNPATPLGHGSQVAGTVGAVGNNTIGVSGVNWVSNILPLRVSNSTTGSAPLSTLVSCVDYARTQGARVVNVSYTGIATSAAANSAGLALMAANGLLVVAAGNNNQNFRKDPNYPGILVVAATNQSDAKASFSNYGPFIDVAAPGVSIVTTGLNGNYPVVSGTSFSSPMVAGLVALIMSENSTLSAQSVQNVLLTTAHDLGSSGYDNTFGYGRINAAAALAFAATAVEPVPAPPPPSGGSGSGRGNGRGSIR